MILINTRPESRAQPLTEALQAKGVTVLQMPLLELLPIDISNREQQYQHDFCYQKSRFQALIVVSPTAARLGLNNCPDGFIPQCSVIAVGHATANVLREAGWQVQCPEEYSNEGMMRLNSLSELGVGDQVLVWRGRGGRRTLVNFLEDNGVTVHAIAWYQRQCPANALEKFKKLEHQLKMMSVNTPPSLAIVLISSGEALTNWRQLLMDSSSLHFSDFNYLAFGTRLTETLKQLAVPCVRLNHLDTPEVIRGIQTLARTTQS